MPIERYKYTPFLVILPFKKEVTKKMAKLSAWLVTLVGVLLVLAAPGIAVIKLSDVWVAWVIAVAVLLMGVGKLARNYSKRKR